ncbi:MAG: alpha/beta hydrolase [Myxococcales bacterium]|nr:alpha/beta hydrolase [Myxococcales bacterium]
MGFGRDILNFSGGLSDRLMTRIPDFMLERSELPRARYLERLRFYADFDPSWPFFTTPEEPPPVERIEAQTFGSGRRELYTYPSRYQALNAELAAEMARYRENQHGYLHLWRHSGSRQRPLVLCIHGFAMAGPARAEQMFKIGKLFDLGLDVALHHLPHHWRRSHQPPNNQFLRPQNLPLTLEEWGRNLHDLHAARLILRELGYGRMGLIGASLGGLTAALYATTEASRSADFLFLVVPAVNLCDYLQPRASRMAFAIDDELRTLSTLAMRRIVPTHYPPRFDVSRIALVAHQGDRICPLRYTRQLTAAWKLEHVDEVVGGHWVYLDHKTRGRSWYGWLERMGYMVR